MVVTVEGRHGTNIPVIHREDVMVYEGRDRDEVTDWVPLVGDRAGIELFVLIDDASSSVNLQLQELKQFIDDQPPTTMIGVEYMRDGTVQIMQNLTADHAQAGKALRLSLRNPGASASPYFSIVDLVKKWPESLLRREILMISDGIDRYYGSGPDDPYVDSAVEAAQKAGIIIIYSIYSPGVGHYRHSLWRVNLGQNYLAQISDQTGGESFVITDLARQFPLSLTSKICHAALLVNFWLPSLQSRKTRRVSARSNFAPKCQMPRTGRSRPCVRSLSHRSHTAATR
jgi:hypothetical protein